MAFLISQPKGLLGIDFGSYAVKVAEVLPGNPPILRAFGQVKMPREGITPDNLELIADKLKYLLKILEIKTKKATISFSSYASIIKRVETKLDENKDLDELIKEEAEANIPFDLEEVYYDYHIISSEEDRIELIIAASKKDLINEICEITEKAKLKINEVNIDIIATGNVLEKLTDTRRPIMLIDMGASKTTIVIWKKESLDFIRDTGIGVIDITAEIEKELNITHTEAEKIKLTKKQEYKKVIKKAYKNYLDKIVEHIIESIKNYEETNKEKIQQAFTCGGGTLIVNNKYLSEKTGLKIEELNVLDKINPKKINKESNNYIKKIGHTAISLAINELL